MDGQLTDFERQALDAYDWAKGLSLNMFEDLLPRSYNKLVEAYCRAKEVPVVPWNKGNSGRNLTTIITSLSKRGIRLNDRGHITFVNGNGAVGEKKGSKGTALPQAKSTISPSKPPTVIVKSASSSSVPKKPMSTPETKRMASTESLTNRQSPPSSKLSHSSTTPSSVRDQTRVHATQPAKQPVKETNAKTKTNQNLLRRQEHAAIRQELIDRILKRTQALETAAPATAAAISVQPPPRPNPPHSPPPQSHQHRHENRHDNHHEEDEEMMARAIRLSLEESEREKHLDEYIRAQLLRASSPPVFSSQKDDSQHKPPMLTKRSSSGRIRASAHSLQKRPDEKVTPASNTAECPVCSVRLPLAEIDSHLDSCLSEKAVAELTNGNNVGGTRDTPREFSKKRIAGDDPSSLEGSPMAKKSVPLEIEGDDCLIVDGPYPKSRSFYYSDPEDDGSDDDDMDDEDMWMSSRDISSDQEEPKAAHDLASRQRYFQSRMFAEKLGLASTSKSTSQITAPSANTSKSHHSTPLSPPPPPPKPKLSIPNSGGLFSEVEFKTDQPDKECPICFEEFVKGDVGVMLPCLCLYHPNCISTWLGKKPKNCPSHGDY